MGYYTSIKSRLLSRYTQILDISLASRANPDVRQQMIAMAAQRGLSENDLIRELNIEHVELRNAISVLELGKTILFSSDQAEVFVGLSEQYQDALDYRLPFEHVVMQFTRPLRVGSGPNEDSIIALLLHQHEVTQALIDEMAQVRIPFLSTPSMQVGDVGNFAIAIFADHEMRKVSWMASRHDEIFQLAPDGSNSDLEEFWRQIKNLAIACIGYINCENVYLHQESAPDKVNRKRTKRGKMPLEPYYVCRIRGVQYDSSGRPTGEGTAHGHRYDVRGHFRRLSSGKTTWVRPHQRGLAHELYIPKTYVVEPAK